MAVFRYPDMGNKKKSNRNRKKEARRGATPSTPTIKAPRRAENPENANERQPVWVFSALDIDGPWGKEGLVGTVLLNDIFPKIKHFETMTWNQIQQDKNRNHSVMVSKLCKQARDRAVELKLGVDELFRFRLSGKQRLWGIRDRDRFRILWWDPEHEVCPSPKRNT